MMQNAGVFNILTCKCAWRHSGVPFFHHFSTYERPKVVRTPLSVFWHFDFEMCFSPQRRAIFPHRNFKKWSAPDSFLAFWLENVLLATAACNFSTSQLQKVVRPRQFFSILTWKCASRHSGVQFFHIATSKVVRPWQFFSILTWKCASRYSGVQFFHIATSKSGPPMTCFVHFDLKMCFSLQRRAIFLVSSAELPPRPPL